MTLRAKALLGAAALVVALGAGGCGGGSDDDGQVAVVGATKITKADFDRQAEITARQSAGGEPVVTPDPPDYEGCIATLRKIEARSTAELKTECRERRDAQRQQVVSTLIQNALFAEQAKELGGRVTDADAEKLLEERFPERKALDAMLAQSHMTHEEIVSATRVQALQAAVDTGLRKRLTRTIGAKEIAAYYAKHKRTFALPERRTVEVIHAETKAEAQRAKAIVQGGGSWLSALKRYTMDPSAVATKGVMTDVVTGQFVAAVQDLIFDAEKGVVAGPVKGDTGWYVIRVKKVSPPRPQTLEEAQMPIQQLIAQEDFQKSYAAFQEKWKKKITCEADYMVPLCGNAPAPGQPPAPSKGS